MIRLDRTTAPVHQPTRAVKPHRQVQVRIEIHQEHLRSVVGSLPAGRVDRCGNDPPSQVRICPVPTWVGPQGCCRGDFRLSGDGFSVSILPEGGNLVAVGGGGGEAGVYECGSVGSQCNQQVPLLTGRTSPDPEPGFVVAVVVPGQADLGGVYRDGGEIGWGADRDGPRHCFQAGVVCGNVVPDLVPGELAEAGPGVLVEPGLHEGVCTG